MNAYEELVSYIDSNTYQKMLKRYTEVIESIKSKIEMLTGTIKTNIEPKLKYSISLINNIDTFISDAPVEVKIKLISSMFPEKIEFDGIRYRTKAYNKVLDLICQETKELRTGRIKNGGSCDTPPACVPLTVLFSNSFLQDLDLIWELREWIPDPSKPIFQQVKERYKNVG